MNLWAKIYIMSIQLQKVLAYLDGYPEVFFEFEVRNPCQAFDQLRQEPDKLQTRPKNNKSYT